MADRLLKGRLEERLRAHRAAGFSYQEIVRLLYAEGGVEVSAETLRSWGRKLGIGEEAA